MIPAEATDSTDERRYRVAVFGHMETPSVLAAILCRLTCMHPLDATHVARCTPGLLSSHFTSSEADSVASELTRVGIQSAVIADGHFPIMNEARVVHHARLGEDALEICDLRGECISRMPWNQIAVIAVGRVPGRRHPRITDDGRPSVLSAAPLPNIGRLETSDHGDLELWLLCHGPMAVYCIKHSEFNYETLGEQRVASAALNFDPFVRQLIQRSPLARQTPGTYAFLHHRSLSCEFPSSEAVQQQALLAWILNRTASVPGFVGAAGELGGRPHRVLGHTLTISRRL